jgi:hypothetical protein
MRLICWRAVGCDILDGYCDIWFYIVAFVYTGLIWKVASSDSADAWVGFVEIF